MRTLKIVTLDKLKAQMRVDFAEDDELILTYGLASESYILAATNRTAEELSEENEVRYGVSGVPSDIVVAILMFAAHLYRTREAVSGISQSAVPYTLDALIKPWRRLV